MPLVSRKEIYTETELERGMKCWLDTVAKHRIPIVLFDTAEKAKGRRLMKDGPDDPVGILHGWQIHEINRYATQRGVRTLWAGGISLRQTLAFGRHEVFGIYVTSAAARILPVDRLTQKDPSLAVERRITYTGVRSAKLLLETGFLITRLETVGQKDLAASLEAAASVFLNESEDNTEHGPNSKAQRRLHQLAVKAWRVHYGTKGILQAGQYKGVPRFK